MRATQSAPTGGTTPVRVFSSVGLLHPHAPLAGATVPGVRRVISSHDELPAAAALDRALADLSGLSFAEHSLESVLQQVTSRTAELTSNELASSITVVTEGRPTTVAATDALALDLDQLQYRLGAGPCLQAAGTGTVVEVADLRAEQRWAGFCGHAAERGCAGMVSAPFPPAPVTGGINLYVRSARGWDDGARRLARDFLVRATVPVVNRYLYESVTARVQHLETAMDSQAAVEQARGILMERLDLDADQAFATLARASVAGSTKLRDLAQQVVSTGEFPPG